MPAPAESKAVATVKLNKVEDVKESQPASQGCVKLNEIEDVKESQPHQKKCYRVRLG